jgi:signal transduction histidine kinase
MRRQHEQIVTAKSDLEAANAELTAEIRRRQEVQEALEATNATLVERTSELQTAQETLLKQERLATLGELTATVSHELRNPMGAIRSSLYLAKQKTEGQGLGVERALDRAERNIVRCDNIIAELLDFARDTPPNLEEIAADDWLQQTIAEQALPEGVEMAFDLGAASATIAFDQERLRRAVINVVDNAIQAMAENPPERIKRLTVTTALQGDRFDIVVKDTGPGMDAETMNKIFEPLFSTKSFGVGLGVPTIKKILESHGGGIRYDSAVGQGTTVTLWLPSLISREKAA